MSDLKTYIVIGAGGTASYLVPPLHRFLTHHATDWQLVIYDGDTVEEKNLERQMFRLQDMTLNKADALAYNINDPQRVFSIPRYLPIPLDENDIRDGDTVFICVDNFPIRAAIEEHCKKLDNVLVINGGNGLTDGSCQIWYRLAGKNITPPLSFLHDEINRPGEDRAKLTCHEIAALPGGGQTAVANMMSASWMLNAFMRWHDAHPFTWHEIQFDLATGNARGFDFRKSPGWQA